MRAEPALAAGRRCGVLGSPIRHSLSPLLHRAAYTALGLDWEYDSYQVDEEGLPAFIAGLDGRWRGLSLTMPLKQAVIACCDEVEPLARRVAAVNTVVADADRRWRGSNTDVPGLVAAWAEAGMSQVGSALVLGGGATARSALAALAAVGCTQATVAARSPAQAAGLAQLARGLGVDLEVRALGSTDPWPPADLVVSTVPVTAQPPVADAVSAAAQVVCDVVYHPRVTPLLFAAAAAGRTTVEGFSVLLHQAALQVALMTTVDQAPLAVMRSAGLAELARRGGAA